MDSLNEIKNWLKKQEVDDPIKPKSKDRVLTLVAKDIRKVKPLSSGACSRCGTHVERLMPVVMKICKRCTEKFIKQGGPLKIQKKELLDFDCDNCLGRTFVVFTVNPKVCNRCAIKTGRTHKFDLKDLRKSREKINLKKPWRIRI